MEFNARRGEKKTQPYYEADKNLITSKRRGEVRKGNQIRG